MSSSLDIWEEIMHYQFLLLYSLIHTGQFHEMSAGGKSTEIPLIPISTEYNATVD